MFEEFLKVANERFKTVLDTDSSVPDENVCIFRSNIKTEDEAKELVELFGKSTNTSWIVYENYNSVQRVAFHKKWTCHHSSKNKSSSSKKNTKCQAKIDIKIKFNNRNTRRNDVFLREGVEPLCGVFKVNNVHNHNCGSVGALRFLKPTQQAKDSYMEYFENGLTPSEAMRTHEMRLLNSKCGLEALASGALNPVSRSVYTLHDNWRAANFGSEASPLLKLKEKIGLNIYKDKGATVEIKDDHPWAVIIITSIMKRLHSIPSSSEVIFCDSSCSCDSTESTVTILLTATKAGAFPIAVLIHESQSIAGYLAAFSLLKKHFPLCFGNVSSPQAFMTDDSMAEKRALKETWPLARQFLCHFHVAQAEWRWLMSSSHGIPSSDRQNLMKLFQKDMYSKTTEELDAAIECLKQTNHSNFVTRVIKFLERKEEWVLFFRDDTLTRDNNTNNYAEATIRIIKDVVLNRTRAFNVVALVEFCVMSWEDYMITRLMKVANNRRDGTLLYDKLCSKMDAVHANDIKQCSETVFMVPSQSQPSVIHTVDASIGLCTCYSGMRGAFCKHQAVVHKYFKTWFPNAPPLTSHDRHSLAQVALGEKCPPLQFFLDLKEQCTSEAPLTGSQEYCLSSEEVCAQDRICPTSLDYSESRIQKAKEDIAKEIQRISSIPISDVSANILENIATKLSRIRNSRQISTSLIAISAALSKQMRRGGKIKCQPLSISRRRPGITRGNRRIPAGRPSQATKQKRQKKKRNLSLNIGNNTANSFSHGIGH